MILPDSPIKISLLNLLILGRRALAVFGLTDKNAIPPKLVPSRSQPHNPIIAVGKGAHIAAWARLSVARETPLGLVPPVGYFADAAFPDNSEIQSRLFEECINWFRANAVKSVVAFMSDSIMEPRGIAYNQTSSANATYGLPVNPRHYISAMKQWGFKVHMDMYEYETRLLEDKRSIDSLANRAKKYIADFRILAITGKDMFNYLPQIVELYNDSHSENDVFVPLRLEDVEPAAKKMAKFIPHKSMILCFSGERLIAMMIAIPDFNRLSISNPFALLFTRQAIGKIRRYRGILFGVSREYRNQAVEALVFKKFQQVMSTHCDTYIIGWTVETNTPLIKLVMRKLKGVQTNKYALMRFDL